MLKADEIAERAVVQALIIEPKTKAQLLNQLGGPDLYLTREGLDRVLVKLRETAVVACTGKRWWLRGLSLATLHKTQDKETENYVRTYSPTK